MSNSIETGIQHPARSCPGTRARHLILLIGLFSATGSIAEAGLVVIDTDATWLAKNSVPGVGWNDTFAFDTAADGGWRAAQNNDSPPCGINGCMIWWDGQFSPTEQVWLRKTFVLDGPIVSAYIQGGADDDATIWVNGNVIYDVFDGLAGPFGPIDIAPYLVPGNNLIAVFGDDNFAFGPNHQFAARVTIATAAAGAFVVNTDATWLAKNLVPGVGWNDTFAFDTAADGGWRAAQNNDSPPCGINGCMIWWDGQFSPTEQVWLRKTFVLDGPIVSAYIQGGADDDATIWVNGNVIYDVFDGLAGPFGPIDIAPYLVPGSNLIAVFGDDNFAFGPNHQFAARLTIETAATAVAVPVMSPPVSMLAGLLLLAIGIYSLRSRVA